MGLGAGLLVRIILGLLIEVEGRGVIGVPALSGVALGRPILGPLGGQSLRSLPGLLGLLDGLNNCDRRDGLDGAMRLVVSDLDRTRRPFDRWLRALQGEYASLREGREGDVLALLGEAERLSSTGFPEMSSLAALAARCRGLDLSYNAGAMDSASMSVSSAIAELT